VLLASLTNDLDQFEETPVRCIAPLDCQRRLLRSLAVEAIGNLLDGPAFAVERTLDQLFGNPGQFLNAVRLCAVGNQAQRGLELLVFLLPARIAALAFDERHCAQHLTIWGSMTKTHPNDYNHSANPMKKPAFWRGFRFAYPTASSGVGQ